MEISKNYLQKFKKHRGNERTDLIQAISKMVDRSYVQIRQLTEPWTDQMLRDSYFGSKSQEQPEVSWWKYRKSTIIPK